MRFAIFSDIHSNLDALEAVLADAQARKCTHFACLGDVVGYNANPHECVKRIRALDCPTVKGNHDEQASLVESSTDFNELAERAIKWTRDNLTEKDKAWLRDLPLRNRWVLPSSTQPSICRRDGARFNNLDAAASFTTARPFAFPYHVPMVLLTGASAEARNTCTLSRAGNISSIRAVSDNHATGIGAPPTAFTILKTISSNRCGYNTIWRLRKRRLSKLACRRCWRSASPLENETTDHRDTDFCLPG
jgi:hypothetical protein